MSKLYSKITGSLRISQARLSESKDENLGPPLPDPTEHNKQIALYAETIRRVANRRGCQLSDIHRVSTDGTKTIGKFPYTDDGIHQTAYGYWQGSAAFKMVTKVPGNVWWVSTTEAFPGTAGTTKSAQSVTETSVKFTLSDPMLPNPPAPSGTPAMYQVRDRVVKVPSLSSGRYALKIDGKTVANATADEWSNGVNLTRAPEFDQVEKLRALINKKNELYFYRWRPQNETYLFGFRKHEQGNNAIEIPQFDPLIAELEAEINTLKKPVKHTYEIVREEAKK